MEPYVVFKFKTEAQLFLLNSFPVAPFEESATRVTSKEASSSRKAPKERLMSKVLRPALSPSDKVPMLILVDFPGKVI